MFGFVIRDTNTPYEVKKRTNRSSVDLTVSRHVGYVELLKSLIRSLFTFYCKKSRTFSPTRSVSFLIRRELPYHFMFFLTSFYERKFGMLSKRRKEKCKQKDGPVTVEIQIHFLSLVGLLYYTSNV